MIRLVKELQYGVLRGVCSRLTSRSLLHVEGPDTYKLLNGLTTTKIDNAEGQTICKYGAFLSHKGRMLADALFYHRPQLRSFYVEVDTERVADIHKHLNTYKLRSTVFMDDQVSKTHQIWSILATNEENRDLLLRNILNRDKTLGNTMYVYMDPRWPLSIRVVAPVGAEPPLREVGLHWSTNQDVYDYFRMIHGIPEGSSEMPYNKQIPLEANLQEYNGISFTKGCYVGQELIARTHHRGELRKRIFAMRLLYPYATNHQVIQVDPSKLVPDVMFDDIAEVEERTKDLKGSTVYTVRGETAGTIVGTKADVVLAVVRLQYLESGLTFVLGDKDSKLRWQILLPYWWSKFIAKEKQRQAIFAANLEPVIPTPFDKLTQI